MTPIIAPTFPPAANMCAAYADETGIAGLDQPMSVLNREIACQVANGMSPNVDADGVVIVWISVLKNQNGLHELVCAIFCATATDPLERILIRGFADHLNEVGTGAF